MPTRDNPALGTPIWIQLNTTDVQKSRDFYGAVFGWDSEEPDPNMGGYFNFTRAGERVAGGMTAEGRSGDWSIYLATQDAAKTVEVASAHGAGVPVPAMDVMDLGRMAVLADPTGAPTGLWQPGTHPGFLTYGEPGAPSWFELHTSDFQASLDFYREVFGLESTIVADSDEFRYAVLSADGDQVGGVADDSSHLSAGTSYWRIYIWTADADATAAKVTEHGGSVLRPPDDTPWGRLAEVSDPTGVVFMLQAANDAMPAN